jgi:hypothetical protein
MRSIAVFCLLLVACGKKSAPDADVDRYVNQELAPHLAKILAARAGYDDISAAYIESPGNVPNLTHRLTDAAYPFLTQALDALKKLAPPEKAKLLHDDLVLIVQAEQAAIGEMSKALDPVDVEAFKAGHAKMMDVQEGIMLWDRKLGRTLAENGVKLKPLPDVEVPKPRAAAEPARPAAPATPPMCSEGTVTHHDTGEPRSCTTEMMFAAPDTDPATPKDQMVLCGPGELTYDTRGMLVGCTVFSDLDVGGTKIPKGSKVTLGEKAKVVSAVLPDGKTFTAR